MIPDMEQRRTEIDALCRRYRVRRLDLFGSAAGGGFRPDESDLDFVVEFESPEEAGYFDRYFGLLEALEEQFARPVDLVVGSAITNPYFRTAIEQSRTPLYAA